MESEINDLRGEGLMSNPVDFRDWWKIIFRVWRPHLSQTEFLFVLFIYDRTAAWGKVSEFITRRHFIEGVYDSKGVVVSEGLGVSVSTVKRTLHALSDKGIITAAKKRSNPALLYTINYEWEPEMGLREPKNTDKNTPKRGLADPKKDVKGGSPVTPRGVHPRPLGGFTHDPQTINKINCKQKVTDPSFQSGCDGVADAISKGQAKSRSRRKYKVEEVAKGKLTTDGVSSLWVDCMAKAYADRIIAPLSRVDGVVLYRFCKSLETVRAGIAAEFVRWVVDEWPLIRTEVFGWMSKSPPPETPHVKFVVKHKDSLTSAFDNWKFIRESAKQTPYDRMVLKLKRQGMSDEEARGEADKKFKRQSIAVAGDKIAHPTHSPDRVVGGRRPKHYEEKSIPTNIRERYKSTEHESTSKFDDWD